MKTRNLLLAGFLCASAIGVSQNTITFAPHFTRGLVLRYKMDMSMTGAMPMTMHMVVTESVVKTYPNGDADLSVVTSDGTFIMNGQSRPMPKTPAQTSRVDKFGKPVGGKTSQMMGSMGFDPTSMSSMMPRRPLRAGETVPIHTVGKGGSRVDGTLKVVSISNGAAKLLINSSVVMGKQGTMKMNMTATVGTADSQMRKMDGVMTGLPGQPNSVMHITMVRI